MPPDRPPAETIASTKNAAVAGVVRLQRARHRRTQGLTVIEGPQVVTEAVAAGVALRELYGLDDAVAQEIAAAAGIRLRTVTPQVLSKLAGTQTPQSPIAVIEVPPPVVDEARRLLLAWGVGDPGNCGTLVRTAAAFGYGYASGPGCADPWAPKVLRSGAGGHFRTAVARIDSLEKLRHREIVGTVPRGGEAAGPLDSGAVLIIGSEAHGLDEDVLAACDRVVSIPMPGGTESLNAAVAGGILAYLGAVSSRD